MQSASNNRKSETWEKSVVALLINNRVGNPRLNTIFDAVPMNSSLIMRMRFSAMPINTMTKIGAVTEKAKLRVVKADESGTVPSKKV